MKSPDCSGLTKSHLLYYEKYNSVLKIQYLFICYNVLLNYFSVDIYINRLNFIGYYIFIDMIFIYSD